MSDQPPLAPEPRARRIALPLLAVTLLLALALLAAFPAVLLGDRTLSASSYVSGVLPRLAPSGAERASSSAPPDPASTAREPGPPARPHVLDPEGAAWVNEPSPYLVHRALAEGRLPLWNADEGLGAPLAANPNAGAWAPLALPVNLEPTPLVQDLAWIARALVLGSLTAWLALELGMSAAGALGAALALMLSGQTIRWIAHHPLHADAFVPLALLGGVRMLERRAGGATLLALGVALALLGGKPQSALVAAAFGALWLLAHALRPGRSDAGAAGDGGRASAAAALRRMPALAGAAALGVALAAIALVPFAEAYLDASGLVRGGRSGQGAADLPLIGLVGLAGPAVAEWTTWLAARITGGATTIAPGAWLEPSLPHAGVVPLLLALVGLVHARRRPLAWALAATIAWYVARIHFGVGAEMGDLPVLRAVSLVKYSFPLYLAVALLAGFAISAARWWPALLIALVAELLALVPRDLPQRRDPFAPAPYVEVLRSLEGEHRGRISGPVDLMPPLISNVLGFADLRAINVLTPQPTYDFVSRLVAPSEGLVWILADPDPLLVATSPGADLANVRWILARAPLDEADLPAAVRKHVSARRTTRLFSVLRSYALESAHTYAGIRTLGGDERFHWTCTTPCAMTMDLSELPERFAVGLAAPAAAHVEAMLLMQRETAGESGAGRREDSEAARPTDRRLLRATLDLGPPRDAWEDLWIDAGDLRGKPGAVRVEITSAMPTEVFLGGVGPAPGAPQEQIAVERETENRTRELAHVRLRYADETALVYENEDALGGAWVAGSSARVSGKDYLYAQLEGSSGDPQAIALIDDLMERGMLHAWPEESGGTAVVADESDESMTVRADAPSGGVLVVPRLAASGWRATVDGVRATIVPVNGALSGIALVPGTHEIRLAYDPTSLWAGAAVSAMALAIWCALLLRGLGRMVRGRRATPPTVEGAATH